MQLLAMLVLAAYAVMAAAPAHADPILTPLLISAGVTGSISIGAATVAYATIASYAITLGAALGLSSLLASTPNQKVNPQTYQSKQALPPLLGVYGVTKLGGAKFFYDAPNGKLLNGIVHAEGPLDGFSVWFLNDYPTGIPQDTPYAGDGFGGSNQTAPWKGNIILESRRGAPSQSPSKLLLENAAGQWTTDHRMDGKAFTVLLAQPVKKEKFASVYPNGAPDPYVVARGYRLYDPRMPGMVWSDREHPSWQFSSVAGLAILHYLTAMRPGLDSVTGKPVPYGFGFPASRIYMPSFAAFADKCSEAIPKKDGTTEIRYEITGTFDMGTERRADVLNRLLSTCDAELYQRPDGKIAIRGGDWTAPEVSISDEHILAYEYDAGSDKLAAFNRLKVTFTDPHNQFQQVEADPWDDLSNQALTGEINVQDLTLPMVPSHSQARRLAKIAMAKGNPRHRLTITTDLYGLLAIDQRIIVLQIEELGIDTTFLVTSFVENGDGQTCKIGLSSLGPEAYDWDPATEEGVAPARQEGAATPVTIPDLQGLVVQVVRTEVSGTVTALAIRAICDEPSSPVFDLQGRIRPQGAGDDTWEMMDSDGENAVIRRDRSDGVTYEVQNALWSSYGGTQGPWSESIFVTATADTRAPAQHQSFVVNGGVGQASGAFTAPNSENYGATRLYRGTSANFSAATLIRTFNGAAGQATDFTDAGLPAGTYRYWIMAVNRSGYGDASSTTGPLTVMVA